MSPSARHLEVAALVAEGLPNKVIAYRLGITEGTAKSHVTEAMERCGCTNRVALALWYVRTYGDTVVADAIDARAAAAEISRETLAAYEGRLVGDAALP